eukprot:4495939-Pyramimonas_sp.AAC.2
MLVDWETPPVVQGDGRKRCAVDAVDPSSRRAVMPSSPPALRVNRRPYPPLFIRIDPWCA